MHKHILIIFALVLFACGAQVRGQDGPPPQNDFTRDAPDKDSPDRRLVLKRELNLTDEQMLMIRKINMEGRPKMRLAQQQVRIARKELDEAIYADALEEELLRGKVRAVIESEAEVSRLRAMSEVAVRKVLTPEQLVRFRELRRRFARQSENMRRRSMRRQDQMRKKQNPDNRPAVRRNPI